MPNYYIYDNNLECVAIVENYASMIWTTRYYESGDFELYAPATDYLLSIFKKDYYLIRDDDTTQAMIVTNLQISTDAEEGNYITITGKSLKSILNRRIIWNQTNIDGNVETGIRQLVTANAISPTVAARKINRLVLGSTIGITDTMTAQYTGNNLGETISAICKTFHIGYDVLLDLDNKQFIFILYKGTDRSYNQKTNPYVVFSNEFENLLTTDYTKDCNEFKNVALIAGEGEGTARKTATIGSASDLARYELYVDARDISSNEGKITTSNYNKLLIERGKEKLKETPIIETIDGEVEANNTYKLNDDYFIGDIVEVINEYGIAMTPRVTEVIESVDENGSACIPTFATDEE